MPAFAYKAYSVSGRLEQGVIEAASVREALDLLHERGLVPFETGSTSKSPAERQWLALGKREGTLSRDNWAEFTRELAVLLGAELTIDQSLRLLRDESRSSAVKTLSSRLLESTIAGAPLSAGLEQHGANAPPLMINLIRAAEARGNLSGALTDLARFLETRLDMRRNIKSALTYPLVLAAAALVTLTIIVTMLVPALLPLFEEANAEAPLALRLIDGTAQFVRESWLAAGLALLGAGVLLWLALRKPRVQRARDRLVLSLPFFGAIASAINTALFARTLGTLLRSGVPLVAALKTSADVVTNRYMAEALQKASVELMEGRRLTDALRNQRRLSDRAIRFISVGEEASRLDDMLLHLADILEKESQRRIERGMALLGPALTVVIGIAVGALIISVMQAVLSVNSLVLQ